MSVLAEETLIVGCGSMGRAVAARVASAGRPVCLTSRSTTSIAAACRDVGDALGAADVASALERPAARHVVVTVDRVSSAEALLLGASRTLAQLAGKHVYLALLDEPSRLTGLAQSLRAHGADVTFVGFLSSPGRVREGRSIFVSDAPVDSDAHRYLAPLGTGLCASSLELAGSLALAAPSLYGALTALQAWAAGWVTRNGIPVDDWFDSVASDALVAQPAAAFEALRNGESLGSRLTVAALRHEWVRIADRAGTLGLDARIPGALEALLGCGERAGTLNGAFGFREPEISSRGHAGLAQALDERLLVSRVGVPARLVGLGFMLLLGRSAVRFAAAGTEGQRLFSSVVESMEVLVDPLPLFRAAERFRWTPSQYAEPLIPVALVARELGHAAASLEPADDTGPWARCLAGLFQEAADARRGVPSDVLAVYDTLVQPRWSARKKTAVENTRRFISPGRVAFFETAGVPFVMGHRHGPYLADVDDTRVLLNLHCNGGVFNFGHRPLALHEALHEAGASVDIGNHHLLSERRSHLARRLSETMPEPLRRVAFGPSATEITDFVIRLARASTGRRRVLSFDGSFHGTAGSGAMAGAERFFAWAGPRAPEFVSVARWDMSAIRRELEGGDVALVLLETVQASSGMHLPPAGFYRALSTLCREHGAVLALDEVQTGWGRTGRLWAFEHLDVIPDVVILGKGMSGGVYPMAAACYDPRLAEPLERDPFVHQSTGGGAELGCAVTEKVLDLVLESRFLPRVEQLAALFSRRLDELRRASPIVATVHQLGLFISVGFVSPRLGPLVTKTCFDRGLLVVFSGLSPDFVQILPPLTLSDEEAEWALDRFAEAVSEASAAATFLIRARPALPPLTDSGDTTRSAVQQLAGRADIDLGPALCANMHPRLLDLLEWSPGGQSESAQVVGNVSGLNADVSIVQISIGDRQERFVMKPLPGFASDTRYDDYAALLDEYIVSLRSVGIRCLDSWMVSREGKRKAWVVQPALPSESLLTARLPHLTEGARRALFRRILGLAQQALEKGYGLDVHLANWALPSVHDLDPVLLDVTQPLLRDARGRARLVYGAAGVPLPVERALTELLTRDLFDLRPLILDMVGNLRIDPALAAYEPTLVLAVQERLGLELTETERTRAARKVARLRSMLRTLRSLFGDARTKPAMAPVSAVARPGG